MRMLHTLEINQLPILRFYVKIRGGALGGGAKGAKAPLKISKKGGNEKIWGIFMHQSY